jgi:hypothetical protein
MALDFVELGCGGCRGKNSHIVQFGEEEFFVLEAEGRVGGEGGETVS